VLPVALLFLVADLALTEALLGLAVEANPIASWLFESIGVVTTGIVAVGVVTLAYLGLDYLDHEQGGVPAVSGGLLALMVAPVVWNVGVWVRLGMPDIVVGGVVETLAPVFVVAGVVVVGAAVDFEPSFTSRPRPSWCGCCVCVHHGNEYDRRWCVYWDPTTSRE